MTEEPKTELQRSLRRLAIATVIVYLMLVALIVVIYVTAADQRDSLARTVQTTNSALCTLRADLQTRVDSSVQFLVEHPDGLPGIPVKIIQQSIDNEQRTIDALSLLHCPTT